MRNVFLCAAVAAAVLVFVAPAPRAQASDAEPTAARLAQANNQFGLELLKRLHKDGKNTFLSPSSIGMALQMTMQGARGETRAEMEKTMHIAGMDSGQANRALLDALNGMQSVKLKAANSIWADPVKIQLNRKFADDVQKQFDAEIRSVSFTDPQTKEVINTWVSDRTEKKIPELLKTLEPDTVTVLVNAIYFKGDWSVQFDKEKTRDADFKLADGTTKTVKMMTAKDTWQYGETDDAQVIRLPYGKDKKAGMWIILPRGENTLDALVGKLTPGQMAAWQGAAKSGRGTINLPRFKMKFRDELQDDLPEMGMRRAFDPATADFSGFEAGERNKQLFIQQVIHEAVIEVNEEGTEAAAATAVIMKRGSAPREFSMTCDRPFLLAIEDGITNSILFIGTVYDPQSND